MVEGDGDNLFGWEDFNPPPNIADASVNAMVDLFAGPGLAIFKVFQDINLAASFKGILKPTIPKTIIGKPILSGAGLEEFIPGFGPGEFILESGHGSGNLFTEGTASKYS